MNKYLTQPKLNNEVHIVVLVLLITGGSG
jgi:hypothetical protein